MRRSLADMFSAEEEQFESELECFPVFVVRCFPDLDCFGDEDDDVRQVRLISDVVSVVGATCGVGSNGGGGRGRANSWSDCGGGDDFLSAQEKQWKCITLSLSKNLSYTSIKHVKAATLIYTEKCMWVLTPPT